MLTLKKVAVTGSIASGKTTICHLFEELGAYVISADAIVHQLLSPQTPVGQKIIDLLGPHIIVDGEISREEIAKKVFNDPLLLKEVEKTLHPEVQKEIEAEYREISPQAYPFFVAEVPLLYEAKLESQYDAVIVIDADREVRKKRCSSIDGEEFEKREKRLLPHQGKAEKS